MITLDQVLLLQEKVESAVKKISTLTERISQLEASNDALNRKCLELTNALEAKTELVSNLESAQSKIEESILKTIDRLDSVEDAVLAADLATEKGDPDVVPQTEEQGIENLYEEKNDGSSDPFVYDQAPLQADSSSSPIEDKSGLLNKSVQENESQESIFSQAESNTEEQVALQNGFISDPQPENPTPSALDGQFDIF